MALIQLDDRRRMVGLSLAELARRSRIPYSRLWNALTDDRLAQPEITRVEHVIEQAEREHFPAA
jgi:hypothetical protein